MKRMRGAAWGAALLLAGTPAAGIRAAPLGDNTVRLAPSQLRLPQNIGPLRYAGQRKFDDRRLGRAYLYNTSGISLSLYVADYGVAPLPEGPDSLALCEQYELAKRDIESGGNYENVTLRSEHTRALAGTPGALHIREAVYEFDRNELHVTSALWMTAVDGVVLKLRLALRTEVADELEEARRQILGALDAAVAARARTPAPPRAGPEATVEVDSHYDEASAALWLAYGMELLRFSREYPETRPPCGGVLQPSYEAEWRARGAALVALRAQPAESRPKYWDELARIEAAGFLDEYAWRLVRDARDGRGAHDARSPPHDLDLAGPENFLARELPRHLAQSGARVRIHAARSLPFAE